MLSFGATGEVVDVVGLEAGGGGKLAAALLNDFSLSISCNSSCSLFLFRRKKNIAPPIIAARAIRPIARPAFAPELIPPALGTAVAELEPEAVSMAASLELVAIVRVGANVEVVKSRSLLVVGAGVERDDDREEDEDDEGGRRVVVGVRSVVGSGVGSGVGVSVSSSSLVSVGLGLLVDRVGVSNGGNGVIFGRSRSSVAVEYPPIGPENVGFAVT